MTAKPALLALLALAAAPAQTPEEIKEFRTALEDHMNGNLPELVSYLQGIQPGAMTNPEAPAAPSWTAQPEYSTRTVQYTTTDPVTGQPVTRTRQETYVSKSADAVREEWRRRAEGELQRIADDAPAGTSAEVAQSVVDDGGLTQFEDERQSDFETSLEYCDQFADAEEAELNGCLE